MIWSFVPAAIRPAARVIRARAVACELSSSDIAGRFPSARRVHTRTFLQVLSFGCLIAVSVSAWSTPATADAAGVRDAENRWSEAFVSGDTATLDALLDAAYVSVNSNGHARPKAEVLAISAQYAAAHPGGHAEPLASTSTIRVIGNAAVVRHHGATDASVDVFHFSGGQLHAWYSQHSKLDG